MMNYRFIFRQLGLVLLGLAGAMVLVTLVDFAFWSGGDPDQPAVAWSLAISAVVGAGLGIGLWAFGREGQLEHMGRREALLLVALTWFVGAGLAGLPYFLWALLESPHGFEHPFIQPVSCYFEAMSGLTTTGASVLTDIEALPSGILLWRSTTHWLGGLGIVVLFVAILPSLGVGGKKLFQFEAPGPTKPGVRPRIRETARMLWLIYVGLSLACMVAYKLCGLSWFDSVNHTFSALATGGFSTKNGSIGTYNSWPVDLVTIGFMVLAGVNFGLYFRLISRGQWREVIHDPELRLYLAILLVATVIVGASILGMTITNTAGQTIVGNVREAIRFGLFQVVSIQTTTGYATADFNLWPFLPQVVLLGLMFIGASAGSTGGGIKVIRILIVFKIILAEIERVFRPTVVRTVHVGDNAVDPELRQAVLVYAINMVGLFALGAILIKLLEPAQTVSTVTALSASAATLNNIGPGLHMVGPTENYGFFSAPAKVVMIFLMALGRLELYALVALFLPRFWRG